MLLTPTALLAVAAAWMPPGLAQEQPLSLREQEKLVEAYFELDPAAPASASEAARLLERLADVPFPDHWGRKRWEKTFAKLNGKRRRGLRLPTRRGEHFDLGDDDAPSGRYFIDGETRKPRGLFVGLHGGGVGSGDAASAHGSYSDAIRGRDWLGIFPEVLEKTERGWTDAGTDVWVLSLIDRALATWDIDRDRVYIGGHSMGGYGSWVLGAQHADRVAALLPSAGAPSPVYGPGGSISIQRGVVPNLRNVPMCVFQSTDDPRVGPEANQAAVKEIGKARERWGGYEDFFYWEVSDRGHGYPEGGVDALLERIETFARNSRPEMVVWQPSVTWKRQFYWLYWKEPQVRAIVEARIDRETNAIHVELIGTEGEGLEVLLADDLLDLDADIELEVAGRTMFRGPAPLDFATWVRTAALDDPGRRYVGRLPVGP